MPKGELHVEPVEDWARLAREVKTCRDVVGLSRAEVVARGGPSDYTLVRIERGHPGPYRSRTFRHLERALGWEGLTVDRILNGTVTEEELQPVVQTQPARAVPTVEETAAVLVDAVTSVLRAEIPLLLELLRSNGQPEPRGGALRLSDDPDRLLTYEEFARWVSVQDRTVRAWVAAGTGPRVVRFGSKPRIRASDALAWLDGLYTR